MFKVQISNSIHVLDDAFFWAKTNCKSYQGNTLLENQGGWYATFVFRFGDEKEATMFALRWS